MKQQIASLEQRVIGLKSLIEVSSIITSTLDLNELIRLVMQKAQAVMNAEASSLMLLNEELNLLECRFALGTAQDQVRDKMQLRLGQGIAGWVAEKGEPLIVPDVDADPRFYQDMDKLTGFRTRSILAAPLKVKGKLIGVAEVLNRCDGLPFTEDDLDIFSTFCRQVAMAIENARMHQFMLEQQRLQQQLESAYTIQQSFMPQTFPDSPDQSYQLFGKNIPATSVGGDLFDYFELDAGRLALVIGDVSGKGIPAALFMARLVSDLRHYSHLKKNIPEALAEVNKLLVQRSQRGMFVTLQYAVLDCRRGILSILNCGHLPPLRIHSAGRAAEWIEAVDGIPLGILPEFSGSEYHLQLQHGDYMVMFTDGIVEAKNTHGAQYSRDRLMKRVDRSWPSSSELVNGIMDDVLDFAGHTPQHDDMTVLVLKWR